MIPNKFQFHTFSFFMSLLMSGVMSLAMLLIESIKICGEQLKKIKLPRPVCLIHARFRNRGLRFGTMFQIAFSGRHSTGRCEFV